MAEERSVVLAVPGAVTETSLDLPAGLGFEEWHDLGTRIGKVSRAAQFWLGDWMAFGEARFGERFAQAVEDTGYEPHTLQNFMWVAKRIPSSARRRELSFSHHAEVAGVKDDARRGALLDAAATHGWSQRQLRAAVKEEDAAGGGGQAGAPCGQCGETLDEIRARLRGGE